MANNFAIFVTITVKPGTADDFMKAIMENGIAARRDEIDCHEFRVMKAKDDENTFHFFELYRDEAALETHRQQPHYLKFRETVDEMIVSRDIKPLTVYL